MSTLLVLLLPPLLALLLILLAAIWVTNLMVENLVGKRHRWLEEIIAAGEVPADWRTGRRAGRKAQKKLLARLDGLIRYAQTTSLVSDEETRQVMLARLAEIRTDWERRKPEEL